MVTRLGTLIGLRFLIKDPEKRLKESQFTTEYHEETANKAE